MDRECEALDLAPVASVTGLPGVVRKGRIDQALVLKASQCAASILGKEDAALVVVSLDQHNSVAAMKGREIIDASNYLENGPFSLCHTGGLPARGVVQMSMQAGLSREEVTRKLMCEGGVRGYTGIASFEELDKRVSAGDESATKVLEAMVYQVAREAGAMIAALGGQADAIVLTGCGVRLRSVTDRLIAKIGRLASVLVV